MTYETYECRFGCGYQENAGKTPFWRKCPNCGETRRGGAMQLVPRPQPAPAPRKRAAKKKRGKRPKKRRKT